MKKTFDLSERIEFDVSLNDGIEFFSKVECVNVDDRYKLRFYPSEKLEQVISIPYWMTRKGVGYCTFTAYYKDKSVCDSSLNYFNYLPSKVQGANTSYETWLSSSSYSLAENEIPYYVGIPVGEEIELRWIQQDM